MSIKEEIAAAKTAPPFFTKDTKKGAVLNLRITSIQMRQTRDVKSGKPETWADGSPKQQIVITGDNIDAGVEGLPPEEAYTIYVKWWGNQRRAFAEAANAVDGDPLPGDLLTVTYDGVGPQPENKALSPERLFSYAMGRAPQNR